MEARDHENPVDSDTNNTYALTITVTDIDGNTDSEDWIVTVENATEVVPFVINAIPDVTINEHTAYVSVTPILIGVPSGKVTYAISGQDAARFSIDSSTGVVRMEARDHESPVDSDTNNTYVLTNTVTDADGNRDSEDWIVTVINIQELLDPTLKENVINILKATHDIAARWSYTNLDAIHHRLTWLHRNKGSKNTSHQGIKFRFDNEVVDSIMNTESMSEESVVDNIKTTAAELLVGRQPCARNDDGLEAPPCGNVTYTISGSDGDDFSIDSSTGVVTMVARDYENPVDSDTNNTYALTITATDEDGNTDSESWIVTITDVVETLDSVQEDLSLTQDNTSTSTESIDWMVHLGSFGEEQNAQQLVDRVAMFDLTADIFPVTTDGGVLFGVRVGPLSSRQSATAVAALLSANGFDEPWILNVPGQVVANSDDPSPAPASTQTTTPNDNLNQIAQEEAIPTPSALVPQHQDAVQASVEPLETTTFTIVSIDDVIINEGTTYTSVRPVITAAPTGDQPLNDAVQYRNTEDTQTTGGEAVADSLKSAVQGVAINEATKIRESIVGTLNPSFEPVAGNWSIWTSGEITIGGDASSSIEPKSRSVHIGIDKPLEDDRGTVGVALGVGADKIEFEETNKIESDNYSLSLYGALPVYDDSILDALIGYGHLKYNTTRKDEAFNWSHTLMGNREADQIYASLAIRDLDFIGGSSETENNNWGIFPYGKLNLSYTEFDAFSESGAFTALTFEEQTMSDVRVSLGVDMHFTFQIKETFIRPFAQLEYGVGLTDISDAEMFYTVEKDNNNPPIYKFQPDNESKTVWKISLVRPIYWRQL